MIQYSTVLAQNDPRLSWKLSKVGMQRGSFTIIALNVFEEQFYVCEGSGQRDSGSAQARNGCDVRVRPDRERDGICDYCVLPCFFSLLRWSCKGL